MTTVQDHYNYIVSQGIDPRSIIGIFCYGSQNYGVDDENSDLDTKCLIIPSTDDLIRGGSYYVKEYHLPTGEHCEVMDIRHYVASAKKQNINFLEIMYTDIKWVNPYYDSLWNWFFVRNREEISRYDMNYGIHSIAGQAIGTLTRNEFTSKKLATVFRLNYFIVDYINGNSYKDCIFNTNPDIRNFIKRVKNEDVPKSNSKDALLIFFDSIMGRKFPVDKVNQGKIDKYLNTCVKKMIFKYNGLEEIKW